MAADESPKAESFWNKFNLGTEGVYRADISNGGGDYGAAIGGGFSFNKHVSLIARGVAYETDNWRGSVVDELHGGISANIFSFKSVGLSAEGAYLRHFERKDNGVGVGGRLAFNFNETVSLFGGAQYRIWNKGQNDFMFPVGFNFSL